MEPLPKVVLSSYRDVIAGNDNEDDKVPPQADLSKVDPVLVDALFPFQREGVK